MRTRICEQSYSLIAWGSSGQILLTTTSTTTGGQTQLHQKLLDGWGTNNGLDATESCEEYVR